jgi:hypothetical protein
MGISACDSLRPDPVEGGAFSIPPQERYRNDSSVFLPSSGLTTKRLRAARFPEQEIDIFAAGNLRVRRDEMVVQLALAGDPARLSESYERLAGPAFRWRQRSHEGPVSGARALS